MKKSKPRLRLVWKNDNIEELEKGAETTNYKATDKISFTRPYISNEKLLKQVSPVAHAVPDTRIA